MYVVIFRATVRTLDAEYSATAARMRDVAMKEYGCTEFVSASEGDLEIALSYWPDLESIAAWRRNLEHQAAQELGRERWYRSFAIEVVKVERAYAWPAAST